MLPILTEARWRQACEDGFKSNGSTYSTDTIFGVKIAHGDERWPPLPADLHDFRFFCGGTKADFHEANREHLFKLLREVQELPWFLRKVAVARCWARYIALEVGSAFAWNPREKPRYG
jgi:hypothetical protein